MAEPYISSLQVLNQKYVIKDAELRLSAYQLSSAVKLSVETLQEEIDGVAGRVETLESWKDDHEDVAAQLRTDINTVSTDIYGENGLSAQVLSNDADIAALCAVVAGGVHYRGVTTTPLTDGCDTNPIIVNGESLTAVAGDIVMKEVSGKPTEEFIFDGATWHKFGDVTEFGKLAFVDKVSADYTPAGTISCSTMAEQTLTATITKNEFTGDEGDLTASVDKVSVTGTGSLTCESVTIEEKAISGTTATLTSDFTGTEITGLTSTIETSAVTQTVQLTGDAAELDDGQSTISASTINNAFKSDDMTEYLSAETADAFSTATYSDECLTIGASAFATDIKKKADYKPTIQSNLTGDVTGTVTAAGSVEITTNEVTGATLQDFTPEGTIADISYTPEGKWGAYTFTPTGSVTSLTAETAKIDVTGKFTPSGVVEVSATTTVPAFTPAATFEGTKATITSTEAGR